MTETPHPLTDKLLVGKADGIGWITFNNPARHNAVSLSMWQALADTVRQFEADDEIRVVVLGGAGEKAFVSGADISEFGEKRGSIEATQVYNETSHQAVLALQNLSKPTIAMIRGYCIGGGLGIALACDLRLASTNSRFAVPAAKLGLGYDYDGVRALMSVVGPSFTKEIFYTARQFSCEEALQMGLINRAVEPDELSSYVTQYAQTISGNAPLTVRSIKTIVAEALKDESVRDVSICDAAVQTCFDSADYIEGRTAFMEKRKPQFKGR